MNHNWIFFAIVCSVCMMIITWCQAEQAGYAKKTYELVSKMSKDTD
jgi:hypothetical protein